jgi:chemotaxis protein methyltransferase CheR
LLPAFKVEGKQSWFAFQIAEKKVVNERMSSNPAKSGLAMPPAVHTDDPAYVKIRDLIYRISGIYHAEQKLYLLVSSCNRRMLACAVATPAQYFDYLTASAGRAAEIALLLNEITIGETYMFRHPAQLEALHNVIIPQLLQSKSAQAIKRLRVWSAGCSTGEEPYTLAMFFQEEKEKQLAGWTVDILATDLNSNSLDSARAGIYGDYALRNITDAQRRKYFKDIGNHKLQVNDLLKSQVRFDRVNLSDGSKMLFMKGIDVIFCCNVLIYFDLESKRRVVQHFFSNLVPGGYLFLGHAESLFKVDQTFQLVHFLGSTAYWKSPVGAAAGVKP